MSGRMSAICRAAGAAGTFPAGIGRVNLGMSPPTWEPAFPGTRWAARPGGDQGRCWSEPESSEVQRGDLRGTWGGVGGHG